MSHAFDRGESGRIYPAKYFALSPTYNAWVKLSATTCMYELRQEKGFEGQDVLFFLNHPIRFIYLVGVVVAISCPNPQTSILTLDDSSGTCIDLVIKKQEDAENESETSVPDVYRIDTLSTQGLYLRDEALTVGTVVKAKGLLTKYRGIRQIAVRRLTELKNTSEEATIWASRASFQATILSQPWIISASDQQAYDAVLQEQAAQAKLEAKQNDVRNAELERKMQSLEVKKARRAERHERKRAAEEAELNQGALV